MADPPAWHWRALPPAGNEPRDVLHREHGVTLRPLLASVDAGGTTFKAAVAEPGGLPISEARVPTTTPHETLARTAAALSSLAREADGQIVRLGIACFGPVDVDPASPRYGTILPTPKPGWSDTPVLERLCDALGVPGNLDTDVNAALDAERRWGAATDLPSAAYVTVGTGIGVGVFGGGAHLARPAHPELGHLVVRRHRADEAYGGACRFHGDCLEGLAAAPALIARYGPLEVLTEASEAWDVAGHYLAQLTVALVLGSRVQRILFGGGVPNAPALVPTIRRHHDRFMAGYIEDAPTSALIQRAALGDKAGLAGGLAVAMRGEW